VEFITPWHENMKPDHSLPKRLWHTIGTEGLTKYTPDHSSNFTGEKEMIVGFREIVERASRGTRPISLFHILPGENSILTELPKENFYFKGYFSFPDPFIMRTS
jgi:hypothetical protein